MSIYSSHSLAAGKTFIYCSEGSPSSFNPQFVTDEPSKVPANAIYNRLIELQPGTGKLVPRLADSWTISKNHLVYTFKLRKDVKFHTTSYFKPTRNFSADDVLFTFNRQRQKDHPYYMVGGGRYEIFSAMGMEKTIKSIEKKDDATVVFTLNTPEVSFLSNLSMEFSSILSAEYADQLSKQNKKEQIDIKPVGTGPFVFQSYEKDSMIVMLPNTEYFLPPTKLSKLVFLITIDPNVRAQKMKAGECHLIVESAPAHHATFLKDPNLKVITKPGTNVGYLSFNVTKKPFDDVRVRKAVAHALNKKAYIDAVFLGLGSVANSPLPPTVAGYDANLKDDEYSPEKAKALLKEAGLPNGFETELWALPVSRSYNPDGRKMAEMMQADLSKVGIKVKIISYDWPTYLAKAKNGDHSLGLFGWNTDNGQPDNFLYTLLSCDAVPTGVNRSRWCDKTFNDLLQKAKVEFNDQKRDELYKKAQARFKEQDPWVTIAYGKTYRVMSKKVKGYILDPVAHDRFYGVELED